MVDQPGIVVLNSHKSGPISGVIDVSIVLCLDLLHLYLLLPSILKQLILNISLYIVSPILYFLMDVLLSIVADHVDVQSIVGVLVPETEFSEVLFCLRLRVAEPISQPVVHGNAVTLAEVEEEVRLVHAEI